MSVLVSGMKFWCDLGRRNLRVPQANKSTRPLAFIAGTSLEPSSYWDQPRLAELETFISASLAGWRGAGEHQHRGAQ